MRTSQSDPLQIAEVSAGPDIGLIGVTFCPGKTDPAAMSGPWARDLDIDLDAIADWGAVAVVTLIEDHEFRTLKVPTLGAAVARRHMDWFHLPIRDVSIPDGGFEKAWQDVGQGLRARLRDGAKVLVHCRGGLGRAGMIAARMLIDLGLEPRNAINRVRAVRPRAIETPEQEAYVLRQKPLPGKRPSRSNAAIEDRAVGALLGLAVGDALGTALEFSPRDDRAEPLTDMVGGGPFGLRAGEWTDDTAMALALANSLDVDHSLDPRDLMDRFVDWWKNGEYSCTGRCFDIGVTTRAALEKWLRTGDPYAGSIDPNTAGNGSLMRLAPVAIRHRRDRDSRRDVSSRQSKTTHGAAEAVDACVLYADLLAEAIEGEPRANILSPRGFAGATRIEKIANGAWRGKARKSVRGSGYVVAALEAALWCVASSSDFRGAVLRAANLREDADTTAAIAGQLAGAIYGLSGIPSEWLERLAWRDRVEEAARRLAHGRPATSFNGEDDERERESREATSSWSKDGNSSLAAGPWQKGEISDRQRLEALANYATIFSAPDFKYGQWSKMWEIPYVSRTQTFEVAPEVEQFQEDMYDYGWVQDFDWAEWAKTAEGRALIAGGQAIERASVRQLAKLITACLRLARFQQHTVIPTDIEGGLMLPVARRAQQILKEQRPAVPTCGA
jgi:ADP-ribosyl-[dinitrogen reductase] hydrolase